MIAESKAANEIQDAPTEATTSSRRKSAVSYREEGIGNMKESPATPSSTNAPRAPVSTSGTYSTLATTKSSNLANTKPIMANPTNKSGSSSKPLRAGDLSGNHDVRITGEFGVPETKERLAETVTQHSCNLEVTMPDLITKVLNLEQFRFDLDKGLKDHEVFMSRETGRSTNGSNLERPLRTFKRFDSKEGAILKAIAALVNSNEFDRDDGLSLTNSGFTKCHTINYVIQQNMLQEGTVLIDGKSRKYVRVAGEHQNAHTDGGQKSAGEVGAIAIVTRGVQGTLSFTKSSGTNQQEIASSRNIQLLTISSGRWPATATNY